MNKYIVTLNDGVKEEVLAHGIMNNVGYGGQVEAPLSFFVYERPFQLPVDESEQNQPAAEVRQVEYDEFGEPYDYPVPVGGHRQRVYPVQVLHAVFRPGTWSRVIRVEKGLDD